MAVGLDPQLNELADRFFGAVSAGDMDIVRDTYTPDAQIWHNFDNAVQTREDNLQLLSWVSANWVNFRFEDVRRHAIDGGFVQQHVMRGESLEGKPFESPSILVVSVSDDHITKIDEYFDPSQAPFPEG